jgi:hypothetical protein
MNNAHTLANDTPAKKIARPAYVLCQRRTSARLCTTDAASTPAMVGAVRILCDRGRRREPATREHQRRYTRHYCRQGAEGRIHEGKRQGLPTNGLESAQIGPRTRRMLLGETNCDAEASYDTVKRLCKDFSICENLLIC